MCAKTNEKLYKYTKNALLLTNIYLLEIECEYEHFAFAAVYRFREDKLSRVGEVIAVFFHYVRQSPAELELGYELEERKIEVAAKANFEEAVHRLDENLLLLLDGEVIHRVDSCHHVGAIVVESLCRELHVDRQRDVGRFHGLVLLVAVQFIAKRQVLRAEVHGWDSSQCQMLGHVEFSEYAYRKSRLIVWSLSKPLIALFVGVAVLLKFYVLHVNTSQEAIVKASLVDIRAIHHFSCLRECIHWLE